MLSLNKIFPPEVVSLFSDRTVDFTLEAAPLAEVQKEYLCSQTGLAIGDIVNIRQVHGSKILTVGTGPRACPVSSGGKYSFPEADGIITNIPQVPIAVRTADCLPIFIYAPQQKCIGIVHAGWRGSKEGVAVNAINKMHEKWGCPAEELMVAFGPAIRKCCYQVGREIKDIFPAETECRKKDFYLDLVLINKQQVVGQGVGADNIFDSNLCTCCDPLFFSYRREGASAGRHLSLLLLR